MPDDMNWITTLKLFSTRFILLHPECYTILIFFMLSSFRDFMSLRIKEKKTFGEQGEMGKNWNLNNRKHCTTRIAACWWNCEQWRSSRREWKKAQGKQKGGNKFPGWSNKVIKKRILLVCFSVSLSYTLYAIIKHNWNTCSNASQRSIAKCLMALRERARFLSSLAEEKFDSSLPLRAIYFISYGILTTVF